jgi:protein-disulfide isomerase
VALFPDEGSLRVRAAEQSAARPVTDDQRSEFERYWDAQPRVNVPVPSDGATVVIVKFTDMQCPFCCSTYFEMRPILAKYQAQFPGAVKMVTKDYPLQQECNSSITQPYHTAACEAAVAIRLARRNGKGDSLEDYLCRNQSTMSPASVRNAAFVVGGVQDFDLQYPRVIGEVKADVGLGRLLGVSSTPSFFINGVRAGSAMPQTIDLAIAYELKKAGKIK